MLAEEDIEAAVEEDKKATKAKKMQEKKEMQEAESLAAAPSSERARAWKTHERVWDQRRELVGATRAS